MSFNLKTLNILLFAFLLCCLPLPTKAQEITPDGTTATEINSADSSNFDIGGGDKAGGNLFHSFGKFGVPSGGSANFLNTPDVENIINRVTGGNVSNIDGLIKANGGANLFLINPAGIVFGANARLDIGGSFLGSTADSLLFNDGTEFSAVNATGKPLLTINAPELDGTGEKGSYSGLVSQVYEKAIGNAGNLNIETDNLKVVNGALIATNTNGQGNAGNVTINARDLVSFDGNSTGIFSSVGLNSIGNAGSIDITAKNVSVSNGARFISSTGGQGNAGNVTINASDLVSFDGKGSSIFSSVAPKSIGNAGSIDITAKNVSVGNGAQFISGTRGQGNAGNITINAVDTVSFDGETPQGIPSAVFTSVEAGAKGKGGDINITANNLSLTNGGELNASVKGASEDTPGGQGDAGSINLNIANNISIAGVSDSGTSSGISSSIGRGAIGRGGDINITTSNLTLKDGAELVSSSSGRGDAGNVIINARDAVTLDRSNILSTVNGTGIGNAGDININAGSLSLANNAGLLTASLGQGNSGNIEIRATNKISLDKSSIFSSFVGSGIGNAGNIDITAGSLSLTNGTAIDSRTISKTIAGNVTINATDNISLDNSKISSGGAGIAGDITINTDFLSLKNSSEFNVSGGGGGNITANVRNLELTNGSELLAGIGSGLGTPETRSGNITINATETVKIKGEEKSEESSISNIGGFSSKGQVGNIIINTGSLEGVGNFIVGSETISGESNAGNVKITAKDKVNLTGIKGGANGISTLAAGFGSQNSGDITINTRSLSLSNAVILSSAIGKGNAGDITVKATDSISINDNSILQARMVGSGSGGDITLEAVDGKISFDGNSLSVTAVLGAPDLGGEGLGQSGNINIKSRSLVMNNNSSLSTINSAAQGITGFGNAGNIQIDVADSALFNSGSFLRSSTTTRGNAGNVSIKAGGKVGFDDSSIFSTVNSTGVGKGGDISITAKNLSLNNDSFFSSSNLSEAGSAGNISTQTDSLTLQNSSIATTTISGEGGNINLQAGDTLQMRDNSKISAQATRNADGGNINIDADTIVAFPNQNNDIVASAEQGDGGNIKITTEGLFGLKERKSTSENRTNDIDASSQFGFAGNVFINNVNTDPTQGLVQSSENIVEPDENVAQACGINENGELTNSFTIVGRGGMPDDPTKPLNSYAIAGSGGAEENDNSSIQNESIQAIEYNNQKIFPARGVAYNEKGQVVLTRYPTLNTSDRPLAKSNYCGDRASKG
jgi:filamentous hemagglutinin family protein